jgi:hypothetical protein
LLQEWLLVLALVASWFVNSSRPKLGTSSHPLCLVSVDEAALTISQAEDSEQINHEHHQLCPANDVKLGGQFLEFPHIGHVLAAIIIVPEALVKEFFSQS